MTLKQYAERCDRLKEENKNLKEKIEILEEKNKELEHRLKLLENTKIGYKNMLDASTRLGLELQGKIDDVIICIINKGTTDDVWNIVKGEKNDRI